MPRRRRGRNVKIEETIPEVKEELTSMPVPLMENPVDNITLNHLHRYFEAPVVDGKLRPIKGNENTRIVATLQFVICGDGTLIGGQSGSAKSEIMKAMIALVWGDDGMDGGNPDLTVVKPGSKKAVYSKTFSQKILACSRVWVPEWQNAKEYEPMFKLWLEGRNGAYDRMDITDREEDVKDIDLPPRCIMTSLAEANEVMPDLTNEMKRRVVTLHTRSDQALNDQVHEMKAEMRRLPDEELEQMGEKETYGLQAVLLGAKGEQRRVINPASTLIRKAVPNKYTASNTFIDYWFNLIEAVAKFYRHDRVSNDRYIFATPGDNFVAFTLAADIFRDLALGMPPCGDDILTMIPITDTWGDLKGDSRDDRRNIDQIVTALDEMGVPRTKVVVESYMEKLLGAGYVNIDKEKLYYRMRDITGGDDVIDWSLVVSASKEWMKSKFPEFADDYEKQSETYIHPFSGEEEMVAPVKKKKAEKKGGVGNV